MSHIVPAASRLAVGSLLAGGLVALGVTSASADSLTWTDSTGDMSVFHESGGGGSVTPAPGHKAGDVTSVVLRHRLHSVKIAARFAELRKKDVNRLTGDLRTNTVRRRWDVRDAVGASPQLTIFTPGDKEVCRNATVDADYQANTMNIRIPRRCLKQPDWVKTTMLSGNFPNQESNLIYVDDAFNPQPLADPDIFSHLKWSPTVHVG